MRELSPAALGGEAPGHIVGVTGPPGAGKSTLLSALLHAWRASGKSVAMLAVDPSSKRSGGSLLGDRARIDFDPADKAVLIRSTAAGERLGGLAPATRTAAQALAAAFDVVVIETVGVGQAETEVADVADTVAVVVQPGSGDVLQFLKSGIMETPDVLVVTKADLGQIALATRRDLSAALRSLGTKATRVLAVSSLPPPQGIDELVGAWRSTARAPTSPPDACAHDAPGRCWILPLSTASEGCERWAEGMQLSGCSSSKTRHSTRRRSCARSRRRWRKHETDSARHGDDVRRVRARQRRSPARSARSISARPLPSARSHSR